MGELTGNPQDEGRVKRLLGVTRRDYVFQFREPTQLSEREVKARVAELQKLARAQLAALGKRPRLKVLLTGATGFVGKEFLAQAASHPYVEEVVSVVRPETIRDRKTKEVVKVLSARERGALLLKRLHLSGKAAARFRFIEGDVEKPDFGIEAGELERLRKELTHVVHCAASVSFDDPYPSSFRANVLGCRNALAFSKRVQARAGLALRGPRGDRDLVHPRPPQALDRAGGRAPVPAPLLQQLLRAHEGDGLDRDRPGARGAMGFASRSCCRRS